MKSERQLRIGPLTLALSPKGRGDKADSSNSKANSKLMHWDRLILDPAGKVFPGFEGLFALVG